MTPSLTDRLKADLSDRYTIGPVLGEGGMAIVYRADDLRHRRPVALKVFRPELARSLGPDRFLSEIRIAANLVHPHILPLHDSGDAGGLLYYVMPLIEGETLRARLERERRCRPVEALPLAAAVASALAYAHGRGVVHRDIKPENILLAGTEPMVADFGIALALHEAAPPRVTLAGMTVGTVEYMSPEQATGEATVDGRSDVYSLAAVLFEMLSGVTPFGGGNPMAVTARKLSGMPPDHSVLPVLPPGIKEVILRALAWSPADRFATAAEFAEALQVPAGYHTALGVAPAVAPVAGPVSLAVRPFAMSGLPPDQALLGDGLAEELILELGHLPGLRVVARSSSFAPDLPGDAQAAGRALGVSSVLEGSVRCAGDRVRVTIRLVTVHDGTQLWAGRYEHALGDIFALQDDIAGEAVPQLGKVLRPGMPTAIVLPVVRTEGTAYSLLLQGRQSCALRTEEGLARGVELLEKAVQADPRFAEARAELAAGLMTLGVYGLRAPDDVMPRAAAAAAEVLARDPGAPGALTVQACVQALFQWDWHGALTAFRTILTTSPNQVATRYLLAMNCLAPLGRFGEAREEILRAAALDPVAPTVHVSRALLEYFEGDHSRALDACRRALQVAPEFPLALYVKGQVLDAEGEWTDARAALEDAARLGGRAPEVLAALGHAEARAGNQDRARALAAELAAARAARFVSPVGDATIALALGERDRAVAFLRTAITERATDLAWLGVRPVFTPLRDHPAWPGLLASVGLGGPD